MINTSNLQQTKYQILNSKEKPTIVVAQDTEFNRKILEYGKFDILLSPEKSAVQRRSVRTIETGWNHVLAKIAAENGVAIGIDISELRDLSKKEKAERLARIIRNIRFCRKAGCRIAVLNFKDKRDASAFLSSLGASTAQVKQATFISDFVR